MTNTYVPLHGHSTYSIGDGVTKIEDIIKRAKTINAPGIALTEHGNLCSFYKFYKACKENDINPIIGCELYSNELYFSNHDTFLESKRKSKEDSSDDSDEYGHSGENKHFIVYAKNYEGLRNIIQLSNIGYFNFYRKPLVNKNLILEKLDNNNIITTGCLNSMFNIEFATGNISGALDLIKEFYDKFQDDMYLELQLNGIDLQNNVNSVYKKIYERVGIKPVISLDYHYANKDDWYIQYLLYVIKQRKTVKEMTPDNWFYGVRNLYIKSYDELRELAEENGMDLEFFDIAVKSTHEINSKVNIEIKQYQNNFPKFIESKEESIRIFEEKLDKKFKEKLNNGLIPKEKESEYYERIKYEKSVILDKNFQDYFLILDDMLTNFVYKNGGATGAGRGSSGGSLVLFVLDITKIDPIKHDLIFARFLNPDRIDPADVDCLLSTTLIKINNDTYKTLEELNIGDNILNGSNGYSKVINKFVRDIRENELVLELVLINNGELGSIVCNENHKFIDFYENVVIAKDVKELLKLKSYTSDSNYCTVIAINVVKFKNIKHLKFIDIELENDKTFQVVPFEI